MACASGVWLLSTVNPAEFLEDQFPRSRWHVLPTAFRTAYRAADDLVRNIPILGIESALDNKGRLVAYSVDFAVKRLIDTGQLPFDYRWQHFARPTGRYLEVRLPHSVLTISQVSDAKKQPRNVRFRANARMNNEPFFNLPEFAEENAVKGLPHLLLVHGYQSLDFIHLAVPHPLHHRNYRHRSENLLTMPHELESGVPPVEDTDTDFEDLGVLKEEIERWRRENGD